MSIRPNRICTLPVLALLLSLPGPLMAQDNALGSQVNGLVAFDFSGDYITPRGLHVEDEGTVVQPLLLVLWKLHSSAKGAVSDLTLTTGVWNSFHSVQAGAKPSRWNEVDPILGVSMKLRSGFTVDASTTAFYTPTDSYATSGHMDFKLTYGDSWARGFSVNPYVDYWRELNDKATVVFDPAASSRGYYVTIGATPTFHLGGKGVTLEVPAYVNLVSDDFYQQSDGTNGGSGLAVTSVAPKISVPLSSLGISHGAWTLYGGMNYYHLSNDGLLDGNMILTGATAPESNLTQVRGGLKVFF
jgi:hypothetical protein